MKNLENNVFCGPPGIGLKNILGIKSSDDLNSWFGNAHIYYVHKARVAIRHTCELLGLSSGGEILAPSYNCGSEIDPLLKSGLSVKLYRVDRNCMVDIIDLIQRVTKKTEAIYVTHYFGFPQPVDDIKKICEQKGIYLIEDCALSLFSSNGPKKIGTAGDISIFSLTKTLPVPDGGVLLINNLNLLNDNWVSYNPNHMMVLKGILPALKSKILMDLSKKRFLNPLYNLLFNVLSKINIQSFRVNYSHPGGRPDMLSDMYYDERLNHKAISAISKGMLRTFDVAHIISRRRENFSHFLNYFSRYHDIKPLFKELPEGVCPLQFPIIVKKRNYLKAKLNEKAINAYAWWKGYNRNLKWDEFRDACFLKDNVLTLPVHQDLNKENIIFISKQLIKLIKENGKL